MGYGERSRTIQTVIRNLVDESRISRDADAYATGVVVMLYVHTKRGLDGMITNVGHHFGRLIVSTLHIHLEDPSCLNIIVIQGRIGKIVELEHHLRGLAGIIKVKVSYVLTEAAKSGSPPAH